METKTNKIKNEVNLSNHSGPRVGVGVLIIKNSKLLLGQRKTNHGYNTWGPVGGYLEFGETFEQCAIREAKEETGLDIAKLSFLSATNNIFAEENKHTVSIFMKAECGANQVLENREPEKVVCWDWFAFENLPSNLFLPLKNLLLNVTF
jgi:8-oxo-dGTP diphosphatase